MKLFALASSILATPAVIVSAAAVAQADGQLTATYDNLKDGVYTTELVDGTKVYRSVGRRSLQTLPGQSTNGILERRGKLPFLTHCGTAENDRRMDPTEMNNAMNEMLATLNTPYTLTRLSLVTQAGGVRVFCCNFNGKKTTYITKELFEEAMRSVDKDCGGPTSLGHREPKDKRIPLCGRTFTGDHFCHKDNR